MSDLIVSCSNRDLRLVCDMAKEALRSSPITERHAELVRKSINRLIPGGTLSDATKIWNNETVTQLWLCIEQYQWGSSAVTFRSEEEAVGWLSMFRDDGGGGHVERYCWRVDNPQLVSVSLHEQPRRAWLVEK